jgi:hypothetical protein
MKTKIIFAIIFFICFKSFGQDIKTTRNLQNEKDVNLIVESYEGHLEKGKGIKQQMAHRYDISKILLLKDYANEIIKSFNAKFFDNTDYYFLCFFDSVPDSIIKIALKQNMTPLIFKAKYGDSSFAEKLLSEIDRYFFANDKEEVPRKYESPYQRIIDLLLLKDKYPKAKEILCKVLQSTKYTKEDMYDARQVYKISISYIAIDFYLKFYPSPRSISKIDPYEFEVTDEKSILSENDINIPNFNQFKADFEKYFYQKEGEKININAKFFNIGEYTIEKYRE